MHCHCGLHIFRRFQSELALKRSGCLVITGGNAAFMLTVLARLTLEKLKNLLFHFHRLMVRHTLEHSGTSQTKCCASLALAASLRHAWLPNSAWQAEAG